MNVLFLAAKALYKHIFAFNSCFVKEREPKVGDMFAFLIGGVVSGAAHKCTS